MESSKETDSLSLSLSHTIALIPLSIELKISAYEYNTIAKKIKHQISMDILKLYAKNDDYLKGLLSTVKRFSDSIGDAIWSGKNV